MKKRNSTNTIKERIGHMWISTLMFISRVQKQKLKIRQSQPYICRYDQSLYVWLANWMMIKLKFDVNFEVINLSYY